MAKLTLVANPTFKKKVGIPVAGGEPAEVEFTFKHRTKDELRAFVTEMEGKKDADVGMSIVQGWDLDEPFSCAALEKLFQLYIGAPVVIYDAYLNELTKARAGN